MKTILKIEVFFTYFFNIYFFEFFFYYFNKKNKTTNKSFIINSTDFIYNYMRRNTKYRFSFFYKVFFKKLNSLIDQNF